MIDPLHARAVIEQYAKHGWVLRRVLLADPPLPGLLDVVRDIPAKSSAVDAFWFSRRSQPEAEAWELRRMNGMPFALVEVIGDETAPEEFEAVLKSVEDRIARGIQGPVSH